MTGHEYLVGVLNSQNMLVKDLNTLRNLRKEIEGVLREEYGSYPRFYYGGSYGKKTMIQASFDLDIVIYFPPTETSSLKIFTTLFTKL
jgi:tRNA nucleotidyltransferase (CCA-adding enzyme)